MKAYVFTDAGLERYAGRFVWLAIDTEKGSNAAFLKKYPINVWPTLLILDPKKESVALRYTGGATVPQLRKLLDDGEKLFRGSGGSKADLAVSRGDRLETDGKHEEAAKAYEEALAAAPKNWPRTGRTAESLVFALTFARDNERCAARAAELYPRVKGTYSAANVAGAGLGCAADLPAENAKRAALIRTLEKATRETLQDAKIPLSGDDRSGLYESLIGAAEAEKDEGETAKLRREWIAFLEGEAKSAKTPEQRAVYDSHRLSAYIALKTPEKAVPMLEQSERDLPTDYNPPARLAVAYRTLGRYDDALAAVGRALDRAYGPRKIGILQTKASIYVAKGDKEQAKKTIEEAITYAESLPKEQVSERTIASLKKRLAEM
jgi:tetratricopeptide (TPR) repeat protein